MFKYSALLALLSIAYCNAYVTDSFESNFSNKYIRASKRVLTEVNTFEPIECKSGSNKENCVCPGKCLTYIERPKNTSGCFPNDCWEWDSVNDNCVKSGKSFIF